MVPAFKNPLKNPLIIALDVDNDLIALRLAEQLREVAGSFKIGPRLCYRYGQKIVKEIAAFAPVFVDNKYFDIPSTMESAVQASFEAGASLVTVHSLAGLEALRQISKLEKEMQKVRPFLILNVTILTSWDQNSFPENFKEQPLEKHVDSLIQLVRKANLSGIVCSAQDLAHVNSNDLFVVTPGIRLATDAASDQKRIMSPSQAIKAGASGLVVARPIIEDKNPVDKAKQFLAAIQSSERS